MPTVQDAMSGFGKHDSDDHNGELKEATEYLVTKLVPAFAATLNASDRELLKTTRLTQLLHREGRK